MVDLTDEIMNINGVAEILWVFSSFGETDMKSMNDSFYVLNDVLTRTAKSIERKTSATNITE